MENKKIVILDFSTAITYIREVPDSLRHSQSDEVMEYFCEKLDIRESDCQYMVGDLTINDEE